MTIAHHPTPETLAAFAAGTLDDARALVVATHVSLCSHCRGDVRAFEHVGGALLDRIATVPMRDDALERALAAIGTVAPPVDDRAPSLATGDESLPAPLAGHPLGPWRWIGRGVQWRSVGVSPVDDTRVLMLKAAPGTRLPHHRHKGIEWTCVLEGAFRHDLGRYGPGDFDEADESVEHKPVIEDGDTCVCLVALQGGIALQSWLGRLIQPLVRI